AILLYLAERQGQLPTDLATKAQVYQWVLFANSTLAQGIFIEANREREMPRLLGPLNTLFVHQPFLMGTEFGVADVAVGSLLTYIPVMLNLDLSAYPAVMDYMQRLSSRPAFQRGMGSGG
ncbi:MAG: glutathione S-transferase family protein, partial [Gloeomargaritaceae cyanobacterium C42_A2020_066]|nr:glutathione S-transferase family protein [Gloeomargaritaceae cyanobacterium C42_A2020_066]